MCGSRWGKGDDRRAYFAEIERARYAEQEPMLPGFASFSTGRGKRVLEMGLGTGTDFMQWVRNGAIAVGRDLTQASVDMVQERLGLEGLTADVARGDAEALEFPDNTFDVYFSWGVLHHTPDTEKAIAEAHRVLKPGGELRIMLYHWVSVGALLVWLAQGPLRGRLVGPRTTYARYVESPGTKMFSEREARQMVGRYFRPESIVLRSYLGAGDLLSQRLSARYSAWPWRLAQRLHPRWFVQHVLGDRWGTSLTITALK